MTIIELHLKFLSALRDTYILYICLINCANDYVGIRSHFEILYECN